MMCWDTDMRKFSPAVLRCDLLSQISRFDLLEVEMIVFATLSTLNNFSSALKKKTKKKTTKSTTMWRLLGFVPNKPTFLTSGEQMSIIFQLIAQPSVGLLGFHFLARNILFFFTVKFALAEREKKIIKTRVASMQTGKWNKSRSTTSRDGKRVNGTGPLVGQNHRHVRAKCEEGSPRSEPTALTEKLHIFWFGFHRSMNNLFLLYHYIIIVMAAFSPHSYYYWP